MLWLQDKTRRSHSPHISCARNGSPSVQLWVRQLPSLRQTTYNTSPVRSHFTSDCPVRQTNYLQHWLRSLPLTSDCTVRQTNYLQHWFRSLPLTSDCIERQTNYLQHWFRSLPLTSDCIERQTNYLQHKPSSLPLYLRLHRTPDKLPTTQAQFAPTLPQTAQYARQTTYNTGSDRSHLPQTA